MKANIYSSPKLCIDGKTISSLKSASVNFAGAGKINSLDATFSDPDLSCHRLFNKKVELFLDDSSAVAVFLGYIREMKPTDSGISITAYDPRTFLTGENSRPVVLTDKQNYDGFTIGQFLADYITTNLSDKLSLVGFSDTTPPVSLKGVRSTGIAPLAILTDLISKAVDDDTPETPLSWFLDIIGDKILFVKEKVLTSIPSLRLSYSDGIQELSYNRRTPAVYGIVTGAGSVSGDFQYGNAPLGLTGLTLSDESLTSSAECSNRARLEVMRNYTNLDEMSVSASKGYYTGIGSIVHINVDDNIISGAHRLSSKRISYSENQLELKLLFNRISPKISDYLRK